MPGKFSAFKTNWERYLDVSNEASARQTLWRSALVSISVYSVFAAFFTFGALNPDWAHTAMSLLLQNALLLFGLFTLVANYWSMAAAVRAFPRVADGRLIALAVVASLIALIIPNFHSEDIYTYISYGWQQAHYHVNPYTTVSWELPGYSTDRMLSHVWYDNVLTYGFAFGRLVRTICELGRGNLQLTFCLFKAINWVAYLSLAATLYFGARKMKLPHPQLTLHLYLWSPLILLQTLTNAHNDLIMSFVACLGLLAAASGTFVLALPALITAGLIKYVWFLSVPFVALYALQRKGRKALAAGIASGAATFYFWANPYIWDWKSFHWDVISASLSQNRSSVLATAEALGVTIHKAFFHQKDSWIIAAAHYAVTGIKVAILSAFLIYFSRLLIKSIRNRDFLTFEKVLELSVLSITLWVCGVNPKFYCWYLLMVFPAALWLPEANEVRRLVLVLSCTHLLGLSFLGQSHILDFVLLNGIPLLLFSWGKLFNSSIVSTSSRPTITLREDSQRAATAGVIR